MKEKGWIVLTLFSYQKMMFIGILYVDLHALEITFTDHLTAVLSFLRDISSTDVAVFMQILFLVVQSMARLNLPAAQGKP